MSVRYEVQSTLSFSRFLAVFVCMTLAALAVIIPLQFVPAHPIIDAAHGMGDSGAIPDAEAVNDRLAVFVLLGVVSILAGFLAWMVTGLADIRRMARVQWGPWARADYQEQRLTQANEEARQAWALAQRHTAAIELAALQIPGASSSITG
ncbi:hypothetical protein [Actinomyces vulturis]|uniref:hypothetical protein n=1 Tax=Actinomyces vulturis TaxID=1857645 RepID=UPI001146259A|nr:hypothetical protein [Actinomyces vulturis]